MLEDVKRLINEKDWVNALQALEPIMNKQPENPLALFCLGQIMLETDKQSIAYPIYKRLLQIEPKRPEAWINMGKAAGELHFYDEEEKCFRKALKLSMEQGNAQAEFIATQNMATCSVHQTKPDKGIHWAKKALKIKETNQSKVDLGFSQLMLQKYEDGWANYNAGLGITEHRDVRQYLDEPEWDGSEGKRIIIYGEQGLGDQIAFAGAVRDARKVCKSITLHVNPKLKNLFLNSFILDTHGYGPEDDLKWLDNIDLDASVSMSRIQQYFRNASHKFTGKPYLMASQQKRIQWKALLDSISDKPKVGIAWTGGGHATQGDSRSTSLDTFAPFMTDDFEWICLEYKEKEEEIKRFQKKYGIKIHDFSWATRTKDYDDTAALVSELDLVIAVPTSVVHLAGALGVPCWCAVHPNPHFMFGMTGKKMPFYSSVELFRRQDNWGEIVAEIGEKLNEMRCDYSGRTGTRTVTPSSSRVSQDSESLQGAVYNH